MLGIPFLQESFTAVLAASQVMQGRFFICPEWAAELNTSNLGDLVKAATGEDDYRAFPAVFMLPPRVSGDFTDPAPKRLLYPVTLLFLTTTYYTGDNQVKDEDQLTGMSGHTIPQDWHDMQRCAQEFMRALGEAITANELQNVFFISQQAPQTIGYISKMANARLSGVSLSFSVALFTSCAGHEDYAEGAAAAVTLPTTDSHPSHLH